MPQLIFVDGAFAEQVQEMADFIQIGDQVKPLLEKGKTEEALDVMVKASQYLNSIPEKEFTSAYNLLIHLVLQAKEPKKYLPTVCNNLLQPITSSLVHGFQLAAVALQTIFNLLAPDNTLRYKVFLQVVRLAKKHERYDVLKPLVKNLEAWLKEWDVDDEQQRQLLVELAETASTAGDEKDSYHLLLKALNKFDKDNAKEISSEEAQQLSLRALRMAISSPNRFDFQDLRGLPTVQALSESHPVYSQLLDIFAEQDLEDYNDFCEEHEGFIEQEKLDDNVLRRKMRLLTFASLGGAATLTNREIEYAKIARSLQIPAEEVEMWAIDAVRTERVHGRLSQQRKVFLVEQVEFRVFGERQWREVGTRIEQYKSSISHLLQVIRRQQEEAAAQQEHNTQEVERKLANAGLGGSGGAHNERHRGVGPQKQRTDDDD